MGKGTRNTAEIPEGKRKEDCDRVSEEKEGFQHAPRPHYNLCDE